MEKAFRTSLLPILLISLPGFMAIRKITMKLLAGKTIDEAKAYGGFVEIKTGSAVILVGDGVGLRFHDKDEKRPAKHQLLIEFTDDSALSATVQMYGGLWCFPAGKLDNPYYMAAREKPSPLSEVFDKAYFETMLSAAEVQKLSTKAFLATEQRIPGLGNGVLQEILYCAQIHPKKKIREFSGDERERLFESLKLTLKEITDHGGRDTEKDLYSRPADMKPKQVKIQRVSPAPGAATRSRRRVTWVAASITVKAVSQSN
jgi:formamidopyrimidine-DNA glycosylase